MIGKGTLSPEVQQNRLNGAVAGCQPSFNSSRNRYFLIILLRKNNLNFKPLARSQAAAETMHPLTGGVEEDYLTVFRSGHEADRRGLFLSRPPGGGQREKQIAQGPQSRIVTWVGTGSARVTS